MTALNPGPERPIRFYHSDISGHSHRVQLFLTLLGLPFEVIPVDLTRQEQREPAFLALNPFGQVPVIDDNGFVLADSNAILVYLAKRYDAGHDWLPEDAVMAARTQRWLSVAAGPLAAGPARSRVINLFRLSMDQETAIATAQKLFSLMDAELEGHPYITGALPTIADLALYTYTAHAPEGSIPLTPYPHLQAWLKRIEALPGFVPMRSSSIGLLADLPG